MSGRSGDLPVFLPPAEVLMRSLRALEAAHGQLTRGEAVMAARDAVSGLSRPGLAQVVAALAVLATWDLPALHEQCVPLARWLAEHLERLERDGDSS